MTKSIWNSFSDSTNFPSLDQDMDVDVAIIGGGITGITSAQLLAQNGFRVAVLEKSQVGMSSTGNSTGNLYCAVSEILLDIRKKFDADTVERIIDSRRDAIDLIEENVKRYKIDCDFHRDRWNYFTTDPSYKDLIENAHDAAKEIDIDANYSFMKETPFNVYKGISLGGAAQFNPLRYVQGLAKAVSGPRCHIFENSEVSGIKKEGDKRLLQMASGSMVRANHVIHATHSPKGVMIYHSELNSNREYGIACKIKENNFPNGAYFGLFNSSEVISTRCYKRNGEYFLIIVGESHKVGHGDNKEHMDRLEQFARDHFEVQKVTHRWGAQRYKSTDCIPYIGRARKNSNVFIATGLSSHGLTYGTVAAQLITDLISGNDNPYENLYDPNRFTPVESTKELIKDNISVVKDLVKDYFLTSYEEEFFEVSPGEGKVIEHDGHKLAVFRNEEKELKVCSAVCSHMGCIVHWNNAEMSWDCPCHGSRFDTDGSVIEGPAFNALASIQEAREGLAILGSKNKDQSEPKRAN